MILAPQLNPLTQLLNLSPKLSIIKVQTLNILTFILPPHQGSIPNQFPLFQFGFPTKSSVTWLLNYSSCIIHHQDKSNSQKLFPSSQLICFPRCTTYVFCFCHPNLSHDQSAQNNLKFCPTQGSLAKPCPFLPGWPNHDWIQSQPLNICMRFTYMTFLTPSSTMTTLRCPFF